MEYRFALPQEEGDILDFIDLIFSQAVRPHAFDRMLPKVYAHAGFAPLHALALDQGRIRGCVAVLPMEMRVMDEVLKCGYVGSVSVHEKARGQGCMRQLMAMQLEKARAEGYDFLALGGRRQRYGYYGFENGGGVLEFTVTGDSVRHGLRDVDETGVRILPLAEGDGDALACVARMIRRQPIACLRSDERLMDILRSWYGVPCLVQKDGAIVGYLIAMNGKITECALEDDALLPALIKQWMQGKKEGKILVPLWQRRQADLLKAFAANFTLQDTEMYRVLCWPRVLSCFLNAQRRVRPLPPGRVIVEIEGQRLALEVEPGGAGVTETQAAPRYIWTEKQAVARCFSPYTALMDDDPLLRAWFPLPLALPEADRF